MTLAHAALQDPVYLEPLVGVPRICVSMVPAAGPFKGKDAKTWATIRTDLEQRKYDRIPLQLSKLKKEHPARRSVELALEVIDEQVTSDGVQALLDEYPADACLQQLGVLISIIQQDRMGMAQRMDAAIALAPEDPDVVLLGALLNPGDDPEAMHTRLEAAVERAPDLAALRLVAGRGSIDVGDLKGAVDHFAAAEKLGVSDVSEPLFHLRRMAGELEDYLKQASSMQLPMDLVDFSKAKAGEESYTQAFDRALGVGEGQRLVATLTTNQGVLECELHHRRTPVTVANFVGLARGVQASNAGEGKPFYDGLIFHRVIPEFMIQGGDPQGDGTGNPGYRFIDEFEPTLAFDEPGMLAMANSGPSTNGSQFFITEQPTPHLSGKHTIFGACTPASVEIAEKIARVEAEGDRPVEDVVIQSVVIAAKPVEKP